MEMADPVGSDRSTPSENVPRKKWEAPRIAQHDLLETVAALCEASPGEVPKTSGGCNVIQT